MESITELLCSASARGELEKVLSLLQAGADVNGKNKFGRTALQAVFPRAAWKAYLGKYLLQGQTRRHLTEEAEDFPLHTASVHTSPLLLLLCIGEGTRNMRRGTVAMLGKTNLVTALLEVGAEPNARDKILMLTVVHDAAREGFLETVRTLADHGADVNLADEIGNLPLHLAAKEGQLEVVKLLLELTEDPRRPNDLGHTALQLARDFHNEKTADFIEQYLVSRE